MSSYCPLQNMITTNDCRLSMMLLCSQPYLRYTTSQSRTPCRKEENFSCSVILHYVRCCRLVFSQLHPLLLISHIIDSLHEHSIFSVGTWNPGIPIAIPNYRLPITDYVIKNIKMLQVSIFSAASLVAHFSHHRQLT
jgi:hypothetical protein